MRQESPSQKIEYIRELFAPEDSLLENVRKELEAKGSAIQVGADEGKILHILTSLAKPKKIVEIGTLAGYSTIWFARALGEDCHIITIEKDPENAASARANFEKSDVADKITLIEGAAPDILTEAEEYGPFDMAFIDADKISYPKYLDWVEKNLRKGGLIIGDNTFLFGTVYKDEIPDDSKVRPTTHKAMKEFNERLSDQEKYCGVIIPTDEGMTVAIKLF